jgi:site-specific recombinase XerC
MPRKSKYPRLRVHVKKGRGGQVWTSYWYDQRHEGKPDISLGTDYELALQKWDELHNRKPRIAGTIEEAFENWESGVLPNYASAVTREGYTRDLARIRPVFGPATWDAITFADLKGYLKKRTAKTRGNRELSLLSVIWNWARGEALHDLPWPAAGLERSRWKNKEKPRLFEVTDELFAAVYAEADQVLRDCMDLATATGMRLTDCRTVMLPRDGMLRLEANKTGKGAAFDLSLSEVLPELIARRREKKVAHLMLLATPTGRPLSARMLRDRWDDARAKAATKHPELAEQIKKMYLRDMRKRASDLAASDEDAAKLLQHSNLSTTVKHYRSRAKRVVPVR